MVDESRLTRWLIVSVLLHGLALSLLPLLRSARVELPVPKFVDVDLTALPPAPPVRPRPAPAPVAPAPRAAAEQPPPPALPLPDRQIVTPPDAGEEKAPSETRLLSDRDNTVPEQMVKRADRPVPPDVPKRVDAPGQKETSEPPAKASKQAAARPERVAALPARRQGSSETQVAALPRLDQLLPPGGDLAAVARQAAESPEPAAAKPQSGERRRLLLEQGRTEAFSMRPGVNDYLPGIRAGDITLLNTKAERFAPFVRRVAARVFQHLDIRLRQTALAGGASSGREYAVVEAIMSREGRLIEARVLERNSTSTLGADRVLLSVTQPDTFFDANPPPGAEANDGNIHFVLLIDLQVQAVQDPRSGRVHTGYHGVAGVGLDTTPEDRAGG
jgi:hypothetical protein